MTNQQGLTSSPGVQMPSFLYGTAWKEARTADLVVKAVQCGFRGIDTACQPKHYNEPQVGEALDRLKSQGIQRESLFVQTKFTPLAGQDPMQVPYDKDAPIEQQIAQSFETSQKNLQSPYIDSLVLHSPLAPHALLMRAWQAMQNLYDSGDVGQLGLSNCYHPDVIKALYSDADVKPTVLQNRFYAETGYDTALRSWCAQHDIVYQSFWTLTANPHVLASDTVKTLARQHDKTDAQILFRYLSQTGIVPLTGTCSEQHMREDLAIFDFELSPEDLEGIRLLLK